jgi:lysophospholipase L1-like esterase
MRTQLSDWPNLARYRAEDEALPPPGSSEKRVTFFGDSITDRWGERWVRFPREAICQPGISGQTTPQMLIRFQQDVVHLYPVVVVVLAGTNDIARNTGLPRRR